MNLLNLRGPDFLAFYFTLSCGALFLALWLRWVLRDPGGDGTYIAPKLDRFEVAYLAGGANGVVDAAVAGLVHCGILSATDQRGKITTKTSRQELARQQAALVDALKCGRSLPPGFSGAQICVAAKSLALKRASGIRKTMPSLGEALGDSFAAHLAAFTENHPAPPPEGPRADAIAFARWLRDQESLPDSCLLQLEIAAVSWRRPMKIVRLPVSKKSALIIKFPVFGVRVFTLLPGWQAKATRS